MSSDVYISLVVASRRKDADEIYVLGIARNAEPLDRLKNRYHEFQKRMLFAGSSNSPINEPSPTVTATRRVALATTSTSPLVDISTTPSLSTPPSANLNSRRLPVFVDPTASQSDSPDIGPAINAYPELGTRKTRVKENVPEVKKMKGTTLRQAGSTARRAVTRSGAGGSKIVPYKDEDAGSGSGGMPPPRSKSAIVPFRDDAGGGDATAHSRAPSASKIMPYRDSEEEVSIRLCFEVALIVDMVLLLKGQGKPATKSSGLVGLGLGLATGSAPSESEALRKDPLKNYGKDAVVGG